MKIVYISAMISERKFSEIFEQAKEKPLQSIQKYHRLLSRGFVLNGVETETISIIPMSRKICSKFLFFDRKEEENGIKYSYVPFINIKFLRQIFTFIFSFIKIFMKIIKNNNKTIFICDILNTNLSIATVILCKIFNRKCIALITDLPRDINKGTLSSKLNEFFQSKYNGYVLLTEYMNDIVNYKSKPYIVLEGLVDKNTTCENIQKKNTKEKKCIYSGGLYEKYGIKDLIDAFEKMPKEYKLYLYGEGEMVAFLKRNKFQNVYYKGVVENKEMVKIQKEADLLINPRFSNGEYTKYSFPSKIIEYMVSGTPVVTTRLKGIPKEYDNYLFFFEEETSEDFKKKIMNIFSLNSNELCNFGKKSQEFVLNNKNNKIQAHKIINFFEKIIKVGK